MIELRKQINPILLSLLVYIISFTSCDQEHSKDYYVTNNYIDSVQINFEISGDGILNIEHLNLYDTLLIYSDSYVYGTVGVEDDRTHFTISKILIEYQEIKKTIDEKEWIYTEKGKYHAEYYLNIDSIIFETK